MLKTITVAKRGEIKKSQKGNTYFLITDDEGANYVCFHSAQHPDFPEGAGVYCKITERAGSDPTIELAKEGEAEKTAGKPPAKPRLASPSDINRSIEKQVALKGAVEITKALIESKTWGKDDLTIKNINATIKKIANSNDEWLMSSEEIAQRLQEKIQGE